MSTAGFTEAELEAAVERLSDGARLREAETHVAAAIPEERQRAAEIDLLLAEETRISMMVGVAVGWVLAAELGPPNPNPNAREQES